MNVVEFNPKYYPDPAKGRPISSGYIYVGEPDLDPEIVGNQKTLSVQQEDGTIVPVAQPIRTSAGGVPQYNGSPVTLLVEDDYSLKVLNSNGSQVYYMPSNASEAKPDYEIPITQVLSGGIGVTSLSLSHTISAFVGYIEGYPVSESSIAHTYTASKDTYVFIRQDTTEQVTISATVTYDSSFVFAEMSLGSSQPNAPAGTVMLFKATTDATTIDAITDYRIGGTQYLSDPRFVDSGNGRLASAVEVIGTIQTTLNINIDDTITIEVTVPDNIELEYAKGADLFGPYVLRGVPPNEDDLVFWLDGTVTGSGGTYTATDRINGYKFSIIDCDFDTTTGVFPFRTNSKIRPPADGTAAATAIQADDVNNFWYQAGGTANDIPFVYFFQNIDYADKAFCSVSDRSLTTNDVELKPQGVVDIVLYDTAQTSDIATMSLFFGTEVVYDTDDACFSPDGNDGTGTGTPALPYLTLAKAVAETSGKIIALTGTHDFSGGQTALSKDLLGVGAVEFTNYANIGFIISGDTVTGIHFNGGDSIIYPLLNETTTVVSRCKSTNHTRFFFNQSAGTTTSITDSVILDENGIYRTINIEGTALTLTGNYFGDTNLDTVSLNNAGLTADIQYNQFSSTNTDDTVHFIDTVASINYSHNGHDSTGGVLSDTTGLVGTVTCSYNFGDIGEHLLSLVGGTDAVVSHGNNITTTKVGASIIKVADRNYEANNNDLTALGETGGIQHDSSAGSVSTEINNNTITTGAFAIFIGNESHADQDKVVGEVVGNLCTGPGGDNGSHGLFVFNNSGIDVKYNQVEDHRLALVLKGDDIDYSTQVSQYNLFVNGRIVVKGVKNAKIYGNIVYIPVGNDSPCVSSIVNGVISSTGNEFKNNMFVNLNTSSVGDFALFWADQLTETFTLSNNLYFSGGLPVGKRDTTEYADLAAWEAAGFETDGVEGDPLFVDAANDDFTVGATSPALETALNLGATYIDALDESNVFGSASVTKAQSVPWDIGTYAY